MIESNELFLKQRRNLMITSLVILLFYFTEIELKSISTGFLSMEMKDPDSFLVILVTVHAYFILRFYQYSIPSIPFFYGERFQNWLGMRELHKKISNESKNTFLTGNEELSNTFKEFIVTNEDSSHDNTISIKVTMKNFLSSQIIYLEQLETKIKFQIKINFLTKIYYLIQQPYTTDYILPVILGIISFVYGIILI